VLSSFSIVDRKVVLLPFEELVTSLFKGAGSMQAFEPFAGVLEKVPEKVARENETVHVGGNIVAKIAGKLRFNLVDGDGCFQISNFPAS